MDPCWVASPNIFASDRPCGRALLLVEFSDELAIQLSLYILLNIRLIL